MDHPTLSLVILSALLVVLVVASLYHRVGRGKVLASTLTGGGLLAGTVYAFFRLLEKLVQ